MEAIVAASIGALAMLLSAWLTTRAGRGGATAAVQPAPAAEVPVRTGTATVAPDGPSIGDRVTGPANGLWRAISRLEPLAKTRRTWVAGLIGFLFGGFGVALQFRKTVDVIIGIVLLVPLLIMLPDYSAEETGAETDTVTPWWYWIIATIAGIYSLLRAETSNRRRATTAAWAPPPPPPAPS